MTSLAHTDEPTNAEKIQGLRWSIAEVSANTVFVQFTFFGSAFILFLNELNLNNSQIGLLLSFFPFLGIIALFIAPRVARFGYKRTFVTFWTIRKFIAALMLFTPWVQSQFGSHATLLYVAAITMGFGLCRAIAEVGYYPWNQEFIPESMRGRFSATSNLFGSLTGLVAVAVASFVIDRGEGLSPYMLLFGVGVLFGLLGAWFISHVPGGAAIKADDGNAMSHRKMLITLKDRNFWLYIVSLGLVTLGTTPMFSFLPLFMKQQVGLSEGNTVLLQNGTLIGALTATFLVGWAADRYGSKPVMLSGLGMILILPFIWLFIPEHSGLSLPVALIAAVLQGIATLTWAIGSSRLLYVNVVPAAQKAPYMAVYYASVGVIGGVSQLLGGFILDISENMSGQIANYNYHPFTPLFVIGIILPTISSLMFRFVRSDTRMSTTQFAGMFVRGNPILAFEGVFGYYRARTERAAIAVTQRLGSAKSPLAADELLEALNDPRFFVRFEAIVSIARTNPDPRYVEALGNILAGTEISLSVIAAWALGRIGDSRAIEVLREGLNSDFRSIRAHCARALGTLGDEAIAPLLLEHLKEEDGSDKGLQMAYASALGSLKHQRAVPTLLNLLDGFENEGARMELALSLARIGGDEAGFIRLLRNMRRDPGTTAAQSLIALKRRLKKAIDTDIFDVPIEQLSHDMMDEGVKALAQVMPHLHGSFPNDTVQQIAAHSTQCLAQQGYQHSEYLILLLHMLEYSNVG